MKLLGGTIAFDPQNRNHVFAVLSSRVCLDPCSNCDESTALIAEAVNSHLRLVVAMDQEASCFRITSPTEPIVAHTAASLLIGGGNLPCQRNASYIWSSCISTLSNLLNRGIVDKGLKGELYARILFIVTRDLMLLHTGTLGPNVINWSGPYSLINNDINNESILLSLFSDSLWSVIIPPTPLTLLR